MTPTQLAAFEARMADRAATEARQATEPKNVPPKRVQPPMPPTGARPCKACHATGYVGDSMTSRTCPSCMGAGWKWLPSGGATV
jgi:hypothetical protein